MANNVGLVRPFVSPGTPVAQKNGWLHDARHTAAIVYLPNGPKIVVVLTYAPEPESSRPREGSVRSCMAAVELELVRAVRTAACLITC